MPANGAPAGPGARIHPAWREPLVWLVVGIPALTVVAGIATLVIATRGADMLVSDGIRKQGLAVSRLIERDDAARRLGVRADLNLSAQGALMLHVRGDRNALEATLELRLLDPAKAGADLSIALASAPGTPGVYTATADGALISSRAWLASIEGEQWRLSRRGVTRIAAGDPVGFEAKPDPGVLTGDNAPGQDRSPR